MPCGWACDLCPGCTACAAQSWKVEREQDEEKPWRRCEAAARTPLHPHLQSAAIRLPVAQHVAVVKPGLVSKQKWQRLWETVLVLWQSRRTVLMSGNAAQSAPEILVDDPGLSYLLSVLFRLFFF